MPPQSENYALARIDLVSSGTFGWQVRLQRRGIKYAKFFSDSNFGSPSRALTAARNWRDALLRDLDADEKARICTRSSRNSSGVVGVSRVRVTSNGSIYEFWQATWSPEPGKRACVKFSITRHGNRKAFEMAVAARLEGVGER